MKIVDGDLLSLGAQGEFDVIIHGCNCHNMMGAGIAKTIKDRFPAAYDADQQTRPGSRDKLGNITTAVVDCGGHELTIVNAYTQYDFRAGQMNADYDAIRACFRMIKAQFSGRRIGYPMIGAGLAGGDWEIISKIIDEELNGEDHTLVRYAP